MRWRGAPRAHAHQKGGEIVEVVWRAGLGLRHARLIPGAASRCKKCGRAVPREAARPGKSVRGTGRTFLVVLLFVLALRRLRLLLRRPPLVLFGRLGWALILHDRLLWRPLERRLVLTAGQRTFELLRASVGTPALVRIIRTLEAFLDEWLLGRVVVRRAFVEPLALVALGPDCLGLACRTAPRWRCPVTWARPSSLRRPSCRPSSLAGHPDPCWCP